jgi:ssDNA-binding Zn-finger/Zn-ribbon topoisomerase 1
MTKTLVALIALTVIIAIVAIAISKISKSKKPVKSSLPYQTVGSLFTPAERSFLGVLDQAIGENIRIFGKVRVADVITPKKGISKSDWQIAFNKISAKHFDFVLCDKSDLSVKCVIELNDSSHSSKSRNERDEFLSQACDSVNLSLIQIPAKSTYSIVELKGLLSEYLAISSAKNYGVSNEIANNAASEAKLCPKCSSQMVKRVAKKGSHTGEEFWACSAFPKCRFTEEITT